MGTWQAGKRMWADISDAETIKAMRAGFEVGITTFDTAEEYGGGHSERIVGEALADFRDQVVYATKVSPNHLTYDQVIAACHRSLKNLNTDYIDLYQIHWPAGSWGGRVIPVEETMRAMNQLKEQGKVRAIGVSNFSRSQLEEVMRYGAIDSVQPPYSLLWRQAEKEVLPFCVANDITVLAYSSLAQGLLTGKFRTGHSFARGDHRARNRLFKGAHFTRAQQALDQLRPIAERHGASLTQISLAWVVAQPGTCAIAGARNAQQVQENAKAMEIRLSAEDLTEMDAIGRMVTDYLDENLIMWD
jgi:aryl-alcohol dehydrogenase-like predicted oxidoreductase